MENKLNLTPEQLEQAKTANSADALLSLAQENGIAMTNEQAAEYYAELHTQIGELSDEEMDSVSGGWGKKYIGDVITEILNEYCYSCRRFKATYSYDVEENLKHYFRVCSLCPNLDTFNYKAQQVGFDGFRRCANY